MFVTCFPELDPAVMGVFWLGQGAASRLFIRLWFSGGKLFLDELGLAGRVRECQLDRQAWEMPHETCTE
jgi:hypothetical protein